jgi:hypothetical protein
MGVTYTTEVIGEGNHASLDIPVAVLAKLGTHKRAPLIITINDHTYRSTAVGVGGECRVVFPHKDRVAAGAKAGDTVVVNLELDSGRRDVDVPEPLRIALVDAGHWETFESQNYSTRKEHARLVAEAKGIETRQRRIDKIIAALSN